MTGYFDWKSLTLSTAISLVLTMILCGFLLTQDEPSFPTFDVKHTSPPDFFESELRAYKNAPFEVALVDENTKAVIEALDAARAKQTIATRSIQ